MMKTTLAFLLLLAASTQSAERYVLSGIIRDAATGDPLVAAHVRILGTTRGTISTASGHFSVQVDAGDYTLAVSMLGYRADTLRVTIPPTSEVSILLQPADIILPEVVVTSEDPAYEIIRRAIAAKRQWADKLVSYEFDAFTRQKLRRDTAIVSITESYTTGYWQQGDTLREIVRQKRQTANIKESSNFASVGRILNFNDDEIRFVGYTFAGPTSPEAFDHYRYKLLRTRADAAHRVYEIRMTPRTKTTPLFDGTILIADSSYALIGVDVEPNEAFLIPFVSEKRLRYRQQFAAYDPGFWMPVDIRIDAYFKVGALGFSLPPIGVEQTSVLYSYTLNPQIPDSIFRKPRLVVDSAARQFDSTYWQDHQILPLGDEERRAYASIDSTKTLDVVFRPGGMAMTIGGGGQFLGTLLEIADLAFNRVEGLHVGAAVTVDRLTPWLSVDGRLAYGLSDKRAKYQLGASVFPLASRAIGVGGEVYRRTDHRPDQGMYSTIVNSLSTLLGKVDYHDYYEAEGWRAFVTANPTSTISTTLSLLSEKHSSVVKATDFSLLYPSRIFRDNPSVADGTLRSLQFNIRFGRKLALLDLMTTNRVELSVEHSDPSLIASDFTFTRYSVVATAVIPTMGESFLFRPNLRLYMSAGVSSGTLPPQRQFDLESALAGLGPFGVMRAMEVKEFAGSGYFTLNAEHNFRSLPFLALGIPFLYENLVEFVVHGGIAHSWARSGIPRNTTGGWYSEVGFGINRIFELLRADFTWRLSSPGAFRFTLGIAQVL